MKKIFRVLSPKALVLCLLHLYTRYVTLLFPPRCRFYPSCSRYAYDAVQNRGVIQGLLFALLRLLKCHPWHEGGFDPAPTAPTKPGVCNSRPCCDTSTPPKAFDHA